MFLKAYALTGTEPSPTHTHSHSCKSWQLVIPGEIECLLEYIVITYLVGISYFWILSSEKHSFIPTAQLYKPGLRMSDIFWCS
jgi:hypothetical protein